jgi:hypothetical protein
MWLPGSTRCMCILWRYQKIRTTGRELRTAIFCVVTLRNNPEERSSQILRGRSLKPRVKVAFCINILDCSIDWTTEEFGAIPEGVRDPSSFRRLTKKDWGRTSIRKLVTLLQFILFISVHYIFLRKGVLPVVDCVVVLCRQLDTDEGKLFSPCGTLRCAVDRTRLPMLIRLHA